MTIGRGLCAGFLAIFLCVEGAVSMYKVPRLSTMCESWRGTSVLVPFDGLTAVESLMRCSLMRKRRASARRTVAIVVSFGW
eukprot:6491546-Amphidinium_carterae.3